VSFLAPDLAFLAYLFGPRAGAVADNALHPDVGGAAAVCLGLITESAGLMGAGLIWIAHIAIDRGLGFGLKYADGPKPTHLQRI
jgi:hypothetical protein